jgi:site-specific recombinase XerC
MRSLLRWAFATGLVERRMAPGVLGPPRRVLAGLPRALTPGQVEALKSAADVTTAIGLRDYALVVMISRLGLRAGEVAGLSLESIDWHHGQVSVHGKGARALTLPLPVDVGEALVAYLRYGRPGAGLDRAVFVRGRPPLRGLSAKGVSTAVATLARRAGLGVVHAHRLRHTAATAVLAAGGTLIEARELLGHARTDTTMIYARTDLGALRVLVIPWGTVPGS